MTNITQNPRPQNTTAQIEARIAEIRNEMKWHTPIQQNILRIELNRLEDELNAQ